MLGGVTKRIRYTLDVIEIVIWTNKFCQILKDRKDIYEIQIKKNIVKVISQKTYNK